LCHTLLPDTQGNTRVKHRYIEPFTNTVPNSQIDEKKNLNNFNKKHSPKKSPLLIIRYSSEKETTKPHDEINRGTPDRKRHKTSPLTPHVISKHDTHRVPPK